MPLYDRVKHILDAARAQVARSVNTAQVMANWMIGQAIIDTEQRGDRRAAYGENVLEGLSQRLKKEFGAGYSVDNLEHFRRFFLQYPQLLSQGKSDAPRRISSRASGMDLKRPLVAFVWKPDRLSTDLNWTHYRTLLRVEHEDARSFYEIESIKNSWSARELDRQVSSLLYERLAYSKDKKGVLKLARQGHVITGPTDVFKDPLVMEFLGVPKHKVLHEDDLEQALIDNLQDFLLEMGKGFALVSRQERITLDGDHFYIDLVFYHTVLKCYVLIDLKVGKLTHGDLGQMGLYVNYFDEHRRTGSDQPTLGLVLCTAKNDAMVKYVLGPGNRTIFTSRYKLRLPTDAELKAELRKELRELRR